MSQVIRGIKSVVLRILPLSIRRSLKAYKTLSIDLGHYRTTRDNSCLDENGDPIPWITYPAIDYLKQFDFSDKIMFEFGSGNSTLFWSSRVQRITSVESNPRWHEQMKPLLPSNVNYLLHTDTTNYVDSIRLTAGNYDIIVIDGKARLKCTQAAIQHLKPGGFILLDNSDWYSESSALLRSADLIEVDFSGFCPILGHRCVTSLYLKRDFNLHTLSYKQPVYVKGGRQLELDYINQ